MKGKGYKMHRGELKNLENLRDLHIEELKLFDEELNTLENIITPDNLVPTNIKQYPEYIQTAERLKRICSWMSDEKKEYMLRIEDAILESIENEEYVFRIDRGGMPVMKKKYETSDKRKRQLRFRLNEHEEYQALSLEQKEWHIMYSDWVSFAKRLHRDFRLLEVNYESNGGEGIDL